VPCMAWGIDGKPMRAELPDTPFMKTRRLAGFAYLEVAE